MKKVKLLPHWDGEAGYGPDQIKAHIFLIIHENFTAEICSICKDNGKRMTSYGVPRHTGLSIGTHDDKVVWASLDSSPLC